MAQSKTKLVNPEKEMQQIKAAIVKARDDWFNTKAKTIKAEVTKNLEAYQCKIIHGLLGFSTDGYTRFEIDHCNGRSGDSEAGDRFRQACKAAIDNWFAELTILPKLTNEEKTTLLADYRSLVLAGLRDKLRCRAEADTNTMLNSVLDEALVLSNCAEDQAELDAAKEKNHEALTRSAVANAVAETENRLRVEFHTKLNEEKNKAMIKKSEETREELELDRTLNPEL